MARQGRKQKARLQRRIAGWEAIKDSVNDKIKRSPNSKGHYMHKPGSLKK